MASRFDNILDECITLIQEGETVEACLARYPELAAELEPALRTMLEVTTALPPTPSLPFQMTVAHQQLMAALEQRRHLREQRASSWARLLGGGRAWTATAAAALLIAVVSYVGLRLALSPVAPAPEGAFAFLISDERNAIGHFQGLTVTINRIGVLQSGESGSWIEWAPDTTQVDLVQLQGDNAQVVWNGNLAEGSYSKVFIYVSAASGVLAASGETVDVKLPSSKLHINMPFTITPDSAVAFVYDLSVVAAGNERSGIKYILKPVIGESGPNKPFNKVEDDEGEKEPSKKLNLSFNGESVPGATLLLTVTNNQGNPVVGAQVTVNGKPAGKTNASGQLAILVPSDAEELEVTAHKGNLEGEVEFDLAEETLELQLSLQGDVQPGAQVTLLVTLDGVPVEGATVTINDSEVGATDVNGQLAITVPADATEMEIKATSDGLEGELEQEIPSGSSS